MRIASRWLSALGLATTLGLASCVDEQATPLSPAPEDPDLTWGYHYPTPPKPLAEEIYLADELEDDDPALQAEYNGGLLYQVELDNATSRANLTLIADLRGICAANLPAGVNCDVAFDKPHIGATPDGERIYVINRFVPNRPQDQAIYNGTPLGYYDRAAGQFIFQGQVQGLPLEGSILAANSPAGELYVANAQSNRLYRINAATLAIDASWPLVKSTGGTLDVVGADIAFDASGTLYLWTNTNVNGGADRGLYSVAVPEGDGSDAIATRIGTNSTSYFTGLAIRNAGNGDLIGSSESDNAIFEIDPATGNLGTRFDMYLGGSPYDHRYGDMTTGTLKLPPPGLEVKKIAVSKKVTAGDPIAFTIQVNSNGGSAAEDVRVYDLLPIGYGLDWSISSQPAGNPCEIKYGVLVCDYDDLAPGESRSVTVSSRTTAKSCKEYHNVVLVKTSNLGFKTASASAKVECPKKPDLSIKKTTPDDKVKAGDKIQFDLEVRSTGSTTARNVVLGDELPTGSGISWYISSQPWGNPCRISYGKLTCDFGNLSPGESRKVTIKSSTSKNTDKTYHNTAWAKADGVDKVTDSAWIKVEKSYYYKDDYKKDYDDHRKDYDYGKDDYWSSWYH